MRILSSTTVLLLAIAIANCGGRPSIGNCTFHGPRRLVELRYQAVPSLFIARNLSDPGALYIATGPFIASTQSQFDAVRVDLATGAQTTSVMQYGGMSGKDPEGWVYFKSDEPISPMAPALIRSRKLRVAFDGTKTTSPAIGHWFGSKDLRVMRKETYTGRRIVLLRQRALLEQELVNYDHVPGPFLNVAVDPAGKYVACHCRDRFGTWIGIFDQTIN